MLLWYLFVVRFVVGDGVVVFCCDLCLCFLLRANLDLFIYNSWGGGGNLQLISTRLYFVGCWLRSIARYRYVRARPFIDSHYNSWSH